MTRSDFQRLSDVRIEEAKVLLDAGKWDGAYYLAGYAVECALKACIAKLTKADEFPPKKKFVEDCYSHDLNKLRDAAGLRSLWDKASSEFQAFWNVVIKWNEQARYDRKMQRDAEDLLEAITNNTHGVLQWVQQHW